MIKRFNWSYKILYLFRRTIIFKHFTNFDLKILQNSYPQRIDEVFERDPSFVLCTRKKSKRAAQQLAPARRRDSCTERARVQEYTRRRRSSAVVVVVVEGKWRERASTQASWSEREEQASAGAWDGKVVKPCAWHRVMLCSSRFCVMSAGPARAWTHAERDRASLLLRGGRWFIYAREALHGLEWESESASTVLLIYCVYGA